MKIHRTIIGALLALMPLAVLTAAPYIQQVSVPPPGRYGIADLWKVTLNNPDNQAYEVWLEGTITEATRGQVFWAKTDSFPLLPGPRTLGYADIQSIGIAQDSYASGYKEFALRTGGLPPGDYTFTVKLEPSFGTKPVRFIVRPMGPPRLISPRNGDTVGTRTPQFIWTPSSPAPKGVTYELKLVQRMPNQTPEEAMRANPPWWIKTRITSTSLTYPNSARPLDTASYAWQVMAHAADSSVATSATQSFTLPKGGGPPPPSKGAGNATIVWQHRTSPGDWEIWYADIDFGTMSAAAAPLVLAGYPGHDLDPAIAFDRAGNAMAVWSHCYFPSMGYGVVYSRRPAGGTWTAPQPLAFNFGWAYMDPVVAFDENGSGLCVMVRDESPSTPAEARKRLCYSVWNPVSKTWSAPPQPIPTAVGFPGNDTSRLPEIAFTSVAATGGSPVTQNQAVLMCIARGWAPCYSLWDGGAWGPLKPVTGTCIWAKCSPYGYWPGSPFPIPAKERLGIASDNNGRVIAVWQPSSGAGLRYSCEKVVNLPLAWNAPALPYSSGSSSVPAVAFGPETPWSATKDLSVFLSGGQLKSATGPGGTLAGMTTVVSGQAYRPVVAWTKGSPTTAGAVWARLRPPPSSEADIYFAAWNGSSWLSAPVTTSTLLGVDCNPDIASPTGSHTMPPTP
jgi:hypothetical protein